MEAVNQPCFGNNMSIWNVLSLQIDSGGVGYAAVAATLVPFKSTETVPVDYSCCHPRSKLQTFRATSLS